MDRGCQDIKMIDIYGRCGQKNLSTDTGRRLVSKIYQLVLLAVFLFFIFPIHSVLAADVVTIVEADLRPYVKALEGLNSAVKCDNITLSLQDLIAAQKDGANIQDTIDAYNPKVVVAIGSRCLFTIMDKVGPLPIVFTMVLNPWSLSIPKGRHITGISMNAMPDLYWKVFADIRPVIHTIGVVYDPSKTGYLVDIAKKLAIKYHQKLIAVPVKSSTQALNAIQKMIGHIDAFWMTPDTTVYRQEVLDYLIYSSLRYHFVLAGLSVKDVNAGAMFAWSFDSYKLGNQAGKLVLAILKGDHISDRHFFWAKGLTLSLNMRTARKIGFSPSSSLLKTATEVIK